MGLDRGLMFALVEACAEGDLVKVKETIETHISTLLEGKDSPSQRQRDIARKLVLSNVGDDSAEPPLLAALSHGHEDIAKYLIKYGADVSQKSKIGNTPLMFACSKGMAEIVRTIIKEAESQQKLQLCGPNAPNYVGDTPLLFAVTGGSTDCVNALLTHGVDVLHRNNAGVTAFSCAVKNGRPHILKLLIDKTGGEQFKIDPPDRAGNTLLHNAARHGHWEIVELLLAHSDADPSAPNKAGETLRHFVEGLPPSHKTRRSLARLWQSPNDVDVDQVSSELAGVVLTGKGEKKAKTNKKRKQKKSNDSNVNNRPEQQKDVDSGAQPPPKDVSSPPNAVTGAPRQSPTPSCVEKAKASSNQNDKPTVVDSVKDVREESQSNEEVVAESLAEGGAWVNVVSGRRKAAAAVSGGGRKAHGKVSRVEGPKRTVPLESNERDSTEGFSRNNNAAQDLQSAAQARLEAVYPVASSLDLRWEDVFRLRPWNDLSLGQLDGLEECLHAITKELQETKIARIREEERVKVLSEEDARQAAIRFAQARAKR